MKKFALIGAAGYIAPRHMNAIKETGNELVAAYDPFDSVGIIDSYFPNADFFTEFERFDRHIDKLKRKTCQIDYFSICSPNYLHDAHIRFGLRQGANVICEKPLVLNPWNIDSLIEIERETNKKVNAILQLRHHPKIIELRDSIKSDEFYNVELKYISSRGNWYHTSWKGDTSKSGGVATNIGVHFFDMLSWIFGIKVGLEIKDYSKESIQGTIYFKNAKVNWLLSIDPSRLPDHVIASGKRTFREMKINEKSFEFSDGFTELHIKSYHEILAGKGFNLSDARPAIEIVSEIRSLTKNLG